MPPEDWREITAPAAPTPTGQWIETTPGSSPDFPLEEGGLDFSDRLVFGNLQTGAPENIAEYLKGEGYDAQVNSLGRVVVQSPDGKYRVGDPEGLDLMDPLDALDEIVLGIGSAAGAVGGGLVGTAGGPAGIIGGGVAGGAAGGSATEAARRGLAATLGVPQTAGEFASGVATEGALGAGGEVLGLGLGLAGRGLVRGAKAARGGLAGALQKPLAREQAGELVDAGTEAVLGARELKRLGRNRTQAPRRALQKLRAIEKKAGAELDTVRLASKEELRGRLKDIGVKLEKTLEDGRKKIMEFADTSRLRVDSIFEQTSARGAASEIIEEYSKLVLDPAVLRADTLREVPELAELGNTVFGPEFVPYMTSEEGTRIFSSVNMKVREKFKNALRRDVGEEEYTRMMRDWAKGFIELIFGDERFAPYLEGLSADAKRDIARAAGGQITPQATQKLRQVFREAISARAVDPKVYKATQAFERARNRRKNFEALYERSGRKQQYEEGRIALERAEAQKSQAQTAFAAVQPRGATKYRDVFTRRGAPLPPWLGGAGGFAAGGPAGAVLGYIAFSEPSRRVGRRLAAYAGRTIEGSTRLGKLLEKAPEAVTRRLRPALQALADGQGEKGRALLQAALRVPEVEEWSRGEGESPTAAARFMEDGGAVAGLLERGDLSPGVRARLESLVEDAAGDPERWRMQSWIALADPEIRRAVTGGSPEIRAAVGL